MGRLLRFLAWVARYGLRIARRLARLYDDLDAARIGFDVLMRAANRANDLGQLERERKLLIRAADAEMRIADLLRRIRRLEAGLSET